jgi:peptidoglycan/LPS O-acetylase OafA/YrhL
MTASPANAPETEVRPAPRAPADRIPDIDWLRGVAAIAVFLFHVTVVVNFPKRTLPPFTIAGRTFGAVLSPFSLGASGVSLFFVLSGLCLALQQLRAGHVRLPEGQTWRYFQSRASRIVPAYWVAVFVSAAITLGVTSMPGRTLAYDTGLHLFFLHGFDRTAFISLNTALWSMATEVQFYLLFPWLFALFGRLGGARFVALTGLFNLAYRVAVAVVPFTDGPGDGVSTSALLAYQIPGRIWEFALGMYLAELILHATPELRRLFAWLWLPSLVFALWCRAFGPPYLPEMAFGLLYTAICGLFLITWKSPQGGSPGAIRRFMQSWGARFGRSSYSFFLLHAALLMLLDRLFPAAPGHPYQRALFLTAVGLPITVAAATALYLKIELPFWKRLRS